ncbi:predicted protein [Lichtheimia corymbifera JMRC:FSU:9682]|uniref:SET domain-containing protein n=1 Tax=Lichtheimia corymbifera JMRC:FSU:9682 TaxID=1263082 RepID=A0A068RNQ2_9FUNG|nr:predicted protein [Lichtheimia corymbifera JMRC:FSU:9682]
MLDNHHLTRRLTPAHIDLRPWPPIQLPALAQWEQQQAKVINTTNAGRSVIATKKLSSGALLLSERACIQWLYRGPQRQRYCFHCFHRVNHGVSCRSNHACQWDIIYCSKQCEAIQWWRQHRWLCRFSELDVLDTVDLLLALQLLPGSLDDLDSGMHDPLYDNQIERVCCRLFYMSSPHFQKALGRTLGQIRCNSFAVKQSHDQDGIKGKAIYLTGSMINHACDPNALVFFDDQDNSIQIRTCRSINKGEGIFISYGPLASREPSIIKRKEILQQRYFFDCQCDACRQVITSSPQQRFIKCQACMTGRLERNQARCEECHCAYDWDELTKQEQRIEMYLARDAFEQALKIQRQIYDKDAHIIGQTLDQLAHFYAMRGSFKESAKYSRESLAIVCKTFGPESIEAAEEMLKLSTLLFNANLPQEAKAQIQKTIQVHRKLGLDQQNPEDFNELQTMLFLLYNARYKCGIGSV